MVIGIIIAFIGLAISLTAVAGFVGAIIWLYRRFTNKTPSENSESKSFAAGLIPTGPLEFPPHFGWALVTLLLGFHIGLYTYVTYFGPVTRVPALGWAVFSIFSACTWLLLLRKTKSLFVNTTIVAATLAGIFLAWRANGFVQTWNFIFFFASQVLLFVYYCYRQLPISIGGWLRSIIFIVPLSFLQGIRVMLSVFKRERTSRATFLGWVKTGVIAFIVLLIFLSLLSQADPVFAEVMREFRSQLIGRWLWTLLIVFFTAAWWTTSVKPGEEQESQAAWLNYRDVVAILGVVTVVVGIFLAVQFQYLFGGTRELLTTLDLTFSEYVRKGFTELLLAVFIGGILSYLAGAKLRSSQPGRDTQVIGVLNTVMLAELGLLLLSAFKRDMLYVETYGYTRVRIVGEIFLIWLAFFLVVLLIYAWKKVREKLALSLLWTAAVVVLLSINLINVDRWVVAGAPGHHEYTDYFYLMQLSEDASASWPELVKQIDQDVQPLLQKQQLNPEEKAQLAGLKLALISFMENRDALYVKYAPSEWLLAHYPQLGMQLPAKGSQDLGSNWAFRNQVLDVIDPDPSTRPAVNNPIIPADLEKYRSWVFLNTAERQAYQTLAAQEELSFTVPERLLLEIVKYQTRTQTDLADQENRLLFELKYQFIAVQLNRYSPMYLNHFDPEQWEYTRTYTKQVFTQLAAQSTPSVAELAAFTCASPQIVQPTEFTVYAVARKTSVVPVNPLSSEQKAYELQALGDTSSTGKIQVLMPTTAKLQSMVQREENAGGVYRIDGRSVPSYPPSESESYYNTSFVRAKLTPIAFEDGTGCKVMYVTNDMRTYSAF